MSVVASSYGDLVVGLVWSCPIRAQWIKQLNPQNNLGVQFCCDLYAVRLRLLRAKKPAPATMEVNEPSAIKSTSAPVDASVGGVAEIQGSEDVCHSRNG